MSRAILNLPNAITVARILACPLLAFLVLSPRTPHLYLAFLVFLAAALSDLWDGYLARKHDWITDTGKLLDPVADKLLLVATVLPLYFVSHRPGDGWEVPWWGPLPLWVVAVLLGREVVVTLLRSWAARRGSILSAGKSGKIKAFIQNIFSGALILWYALLGTARHRGWEESLAWGVWGALHGFVVALSLAVALFLTVYSMGVYLWENRALFRAGGSPP
jgi:CDP-diacylglycerol---glycerol-3-phosphate 3-phosphatidyltransferase